MCVHRAAYSAGVKYPGSNGGAVVVLVLEVADHHAGLEQSVPVVTVKALFAHHQPAETATSFPDRWRAWPKRPTSPTPQRCASSCDIARRYNRAEQPAVRLTPKAPTISFWLCRQVFG